LQGRHPALFDGQATELCGDLDQKVTHRGFNVFCDPFSFQCCTSTPAGCLETCPGPDLDRRRDLLRLPSETSKAIVGGKALLVKRDRDLGDVLVEVTPELAARLERRDALGECLAVQDGDCRWLSRPRSRPTNRCRSIGRSASRFGSSVGCLGRCSTHTSPAASSGAAPRRRRTRPP
jgi:hypothetical protein